MYPIQMHSNIFISHQDTSTLEEYESVISFCVCKVALSVSNRKRGKESQATTPHSVISSQCAIVKSIHHGEQELY